MRLSGAFLSLLFSPILLAELAIVQPVVARFDGGPSIVSGSGFGSGESIFFTFDISGFKPEGDEDLKLNLSWQCQAFDAAGIALAKPETGDIKVDLAPEDKKWRPRIRVEIPMPQALAGGAAEIRVSAVDHVGATKAALQVPILLRGPQLSGIDKVQPLRFRFLRADDATEPLTVPAYRPGDTVWARFEIAGYQLGEGNAFQVSYGLEVFRPNGESLFQQDEAANESGKSLYPRRYVTGTLSLALTKDLPLGEYTILLRIKDGIGGGQSESKHSFRVE